MNHSNKPNACASARSLRRSLLRSFSLICLEFETPDQFFDGKSCLSLRAQYEINKDAVLQGIRKETERKRCASALDSLKRLFDIPCKGCDPISRAVAQEAWVKKNIEDQPPQDLLNECQEWVPRLKREVRRILGRWRVRGTDPPSQDNIYTPDRQGCYETTSKEGGTLATPIEEEVRSNRLLRMGIVKTKGKFRVVTMQGARVKRILAPIHNALYNHISREDWLVRGDVRASDFRAVCSDLRKGEMLISGDYESATDNILFPAVRAVRDVVIETCTDMTEEEKTVLYESFDDSFVLFRDGGGWRNEMLRRGSMMGNLCSFPFLCLLNAACFRLANKALGRGERVGRFNGDDCLFAGDDDFYRTWRDITSHFGLIVNERKTGRSRVWCCLNSTWYSRTIKRIIPKPVLSFFRIDRREPGEILSSVIRGLSSFKSDLTVATICQVMRHEICIRGVAESLSSIPAHWRRFLLRKRWFRNAVMAPPSLGRTCGIIREYEYTVSAVPREQHRDLVDGLCEIDRQSWLKQWKGVRADDAVEVSRYKGRKKSKWYYPGFSRVIIDRKGYKSRDQPRIPARTHYILGREWGYVLPLTVASGLKDNFPFIFYTLCNTKWATDHWRLSSKMRPTTVRDPVRLYPPPVQKHICAATLNGVLIWGGSLNEI